MELSRRDWMLAAGTAAFQSRAGAAPLLPARADFEVVKAGTCLNNARWHPISIGAASAVNEYLKYKASGCGIDAMDYSGGMQKRVKAQYAELIHARPTEISYVPSTTVGENLIAASLDLPRGGVVTDALHFEGSLYQYGELARQGLEVRTIRPREWRIELADMEKAIDANTRLVAVSLVSMINGFQFEPMTPADSTSPIVSFAKTTTSDLARRLKAASVDIAVYPHRVRISPSVYNDQSDIDKLLEALI